jgi:hypothetical protein
MARIELSKSTLSKIREGVKDEGCWIIDNDLYILFDYINKSVIVRNKHTNQQFDLNCRDRRLIFKYFQP